jgi:hypothetical protein
MKSIQTKEEHAAALKQVDKLKQNHLQPSSEEWNELEMLSQRIAQYNKERGLIVFLSEGNEYVNELSIQFSVD